MSFLFQQSAVPTEAELKRREALINAMGRRRGGVKNIGDGIADLGEGIAQAVMRSRQKRDLANSAAFQTDALRNVIGGRLDGGGVPSGAPGRPGFGVSIPAAPIPVESSTPVQDNFNVGASFDSLPPERFSSAQDFDPQNPAPASVQEPQAPTQAVQAPARLSGNKQDFINALMPAAIEESKRTGIDPRIIVAQAAQETGWGRSAPGNNYFGIKSHGQSGGQTFTTHEVINGKRVKVRDSFRQYATPGDSVRGYGDFILRNQRYGNFREAQGLDNQLAALQASGYATDPNYSRSVGAIARGIDLSAYGGAVPQTAAQDAISAFDGGAPTLPAGTQVASLDPGFAPSESGGQQSQFIAPQGQNPEFGSVQQAFNAVPGQLDVGTVNQAFASVPQGPDFGTVAQGFPGNAPAPQPIPEVRPQPAEPQASPLVGAIRRLFPAQGGQQPAYNEGRVGDSAPLPAQFGAFGDILGKPVFGGQQNAPEGRQRVAQALSGAPAPVASPGVSAVSGALQGRQQPQSIAPAPQPAPQVAPQSQPSAEQINARRQQLYAIVTDPRLNAQTRSIAAAELKRFEEQYSPSGISARELNQLKLERERIELDQLRNPPQNRIVTGDDAKALGLDPTKSYNVSPDGKATQIGGNGTTVNIGQSEFGTIPPGFELFTDPETGTRRMQPIPGGPAEAEAQSAEEKASAAQGQRDIAGNIVTQDIDRAIDLIEANPIQTTGVGGAALKNVPGTVTNDVRALLDTIRANAGFDKLQAMRDASPTGGALGQVSEMENRLLQAAIGNLEQSQTTDQLIRNLKRVRKIYQDIIHGPSETQDGTVPEGIDPEDYKFMSPEERALWK